MKPFTFYDIYYTPLKELDDKHAGKFFRLLCYFLDGKQVTIDAESDPIHKTGDEKDANEIP